MQAKEYKKILHDLEADADVEGSCIVSRDGLLIYSDMPDTLHPEAFAAMTATLLGAAEAAMDEVKKGIPQKVVVEGKNFYIITIGAGPKALLTVITQSNDLENIGKAAVRAAEKIEKIV